MTDSEGLDEIAALLDGNEWSADTAPAIAAIVRDTYNYDGSPRVIREPDDADDQPAPPARPTPQSLDRVRNLLTDVANEWDSLDPPPTRAANHAKILTFIEQLTRLVDAEMERDRELLEGR